MYPQASPLIHDSRKWTYKYEGGSEEPSLPGTSDDHSFSDSVFDSIKRRLRPHSSAVTMEKTLAPLLEKEDPQDDGGEMGCTSMPHIEDGSVPVIASRRRAHSLTKNMSIMKLEEEEEEEVGEEEVDEIKGSCDNVFRKSNLDMGPVRRLFLSEGNLLQASDPKLNYDEGGNAESTMGERSLLKEDSNASFESGILKLVNYPTSDDPRSPESMESSLEYKPFQSPDVQALLLSSSSTHPRTPFQRDNETTPPARSLPRNFHRQPPTLPPVRQMSEGHIAGGVKGVKSPHFMIGSPPLSSPISIDKSMSVHSSSRGSFSEGFMEELSEVQEEETARERRVKEGGDKREGAQECDEKVLFRTDVKTSDPNPPQCESSSCPSSVRNSKRISCESTDEELPLPDGSPSVGVAKGNPFKLHLATSRDSGLSDSPDPVTDVDSSSSSPHHGMISSRILLDKLSQLEPRQHKPHPSPLVNANTPPKGSGESIHIPGRYRPHQKKSRVTRHLMRVMKSLDLDDPPILSPELGGANSRDSTHPDERLRMISPDSVCSPSDGVGGDWSLRRSKSHAEGVYPHSLEEVGEDGEDERIVGGGFIISEGKIGRRRASRQLSNNIEDRGLSKSIDTL